MRQVMVVIAGQDYEKKDLVQVFKAAHAAGPSHSNDMAFLRFSKKVVHVQ